jgi:hypothetical protein
VRQFTLGKKLSFRAPGASGRAQRGCCSAEEVEETGLTINIVNPSAGADKPGLAEEMRAMSREGRVPRLVEPDEMVPPLLYVVSREADNVNGRRFERQLGLVTAARRSRAPRRPPRRLREQRATPPDHGNALT